MAIPRSVECFDIGDQPGSFCDETEESVRRMARRFTPVEAVAVKLAQETIRRARASPKRLGSEPLTWFQLFKLMHEIALENVDKN
ncbi:hypothetical protein [Pararhizobium arenae]|uniref:hypothetical protein n=1 Tax=Pararhizobium arenae TaxID=1856850 RepID=UPI00094B0713|nr:hypothetical protein [Pararhizobium arenae]